MKKLFLIVATILLSKFCFAQNIDSLYYSWKQKIIQDSAKYYDIKNKALTYFSNMPDSVVRREHKFFNRSDYFWNGRVSLPNSAENGTIKAYSKAINENILNYSICDGTYNGANWQFVGPKIDNTVNLSGIVTAIFADPSNNGEIYAGYTNSFGNNNDVYLIKTDENGFSGIDSHNNKDYKVNLYPNPSSGTVYLEFPITIEETVNCEIYNLQGELVKSEKAKTNTTKINLTDSGIYFIRVTGKSFNVIRKIIIY